ncbi:MAG: hypothetical protein ACYTGQ_06330 [Planctomycetota bacterium]|jgi:hypothetical protein
MIASNENGSGPAGALEPEKLTWAALLGRWIEFAKSSVALPDDGAGRAFKAVVPDIIGLQAVCMALGEADQLEPDQRALGLDRARILVEKHAAHIAERFEGQDVPSGLGALVADAHAAILEAEAIDATAEGAEG